jgi:hypothetical protein
MSKTGNLKKIEELFINGDYIDKPKAELIKDLTVYIKSNPLYINEIKNYLKDNDTNLFKKYGECFKHNPGVTCAFGIPYASSKSNLETSHIKIFETYKPIYKSTTILKEEKYEKQKLKQKNKKERIKRYKDKETDKKENEKKIKDIKRRIRKQN